MLKQDASLWTSSAAVNPVYPNTARWRRWAYRFARWILDKAGVSFWIKMSVRDVATLVNTEQAKAIAFLHGLKVRDSKPAVCSPDFASAQVATGGKS